MGRPLVPRRGTPRRRRDRRGGSYVPQRPAWDYRPLGATLDQLQRVRRYYDFVDVDTDRYLIDDEQRQVMLSARELALEQNPLAIGFVNERIIYTHGIGAAMVPVNEVANEGQPRLFIRNLPPVSSRARRSPSHGSTSASGRRITSSPAPDRPSSISRPARARAAPILDGDALDRRNRDPSAAAR